jgi:hypothetical protein
MKKYILLFIVFFVIIFFATHGLTNNYFEQDEWGAFGDAIYSFNLPWWNFLISRGVHFDPLGALLWLAFYKVFVLNASYYVVFALLEHALATLLVFIFTARLTKQKMFAFTVSLLFALNSRADEAFMHLAVFSTTISCFIFMMLFLLYLQNISSKFITKKNILILFLLFLGGSGFREESAMFIPLGIMYILVFSREKINKKNIFPGLLFALGIIIFFILRTISAHFNTMPIPSSVSDSLGPVYYNLLSLPVKLLVQNIVSAISMFNYVSDHIDRVYPKTYLPFYLYSPAILDFCFFILFTLFFLFYYVLSFFSERKKSMQYALFFIVWIIANAFVLSFAGRRLYLIDQRYLYFASLPALFLFVYMIFSLGRIRIKIAAFSFIKNIALVTVIVFVIFISYKQLQVAVVTKVTSANARRTVLGSIKKTYPTIPNNTIFYFQCEQVCYRNNEFGLSPQYVLPFSSGPGWNILVIYSVGHERTWGKFLTNDFLLNLGSQGYEKVGGYSFGYFTDKNLLEKTLKKDKINKDIVIALEYNEADFSVKDISKQLRRELNEK